MPPLTFSSYIQMNFTSGGMAPEPVVPFVLILMLHLLSQCNVTVANMRSLSLSLSLSLIAGTLFPSYA